MAPSVRKSRYAWNEPGQAHYLTYSCHQRLPLLARDRTRAWVVEALEGTRVRLNVALWAYVIMPEHVHVLLYPRCGNYEMRSILASLKRPVAAATHRWLRKQNEQQWLERLTVTYPSRRVFRFWQPGGGYDPNIFKERTVPSVIEYIHCNPVRRGLVERVIDWQWSSARYWEGWSDVPLRLDEPFV